MMPYFFTNLLVSRKAGQLGFLIFSMVVIVAQTSCAGLNNCNGHGVCTINSRCECFEGWGSKSDLTTYRAPDCSARVCPADLSWGDVTKRDGSAHNRAECSDRGICDRVTGKCKCSSGFEGAACQRLKCPNNCSGHGSCVPMQRLASKLNAFPLTDRIMTYESSNVSTYAQTYYNTNEIEQILTRGDLQSSAAWDSLKIAGCLCESSWAVGLKVNETQQAEWFGPDCSQRKLLDKLQTVLVLQSHCE